MEDGIGLVELLEALREGVGSLFPEKIWVRAEIASVQARANGHCYLELSQSDSDGVSAKARAVIWRSRYASLKYGFREATGSDLQPGMAILAFVQVSFSELYGLTLVIDDIEPQFTLGEAEAKRRRTIELLEQEGSMDRQKRLELPRLPYRLAVISAAGAAGYGDFCRHLNENEFGYVFEIRLFEAAMQGEGAPDSISDALEQIETSNEKFDAALIIRGGGSNLDLACFDDYGLCLNIADCSIPVFTAIGHDRDLHVADMVAFRYVKTPTALADEFISAYVEEEEVLETFRTRLSLAFLNKISQMESKLDVLVSRIRSADPRVVLERGYSLVTDSKGVIVKSASSLKSGDALEIMFPDGKVQVTVK